jgi:catechol 2,3-dioxygenase-like lactoylglutathione lyase family enzyme
VSVPRIEQLSRFSLTTADANQAARFYEAAFGCRRLVSDRLGGADFERLMGVEGGATRVTLGLGHEVVELLQFDVPGEPYPAAASSTDLAFQHFAITVADMKRAFERLSGVGGWSPISRGGPQRLPESSGGVTAFKFRDPEGHPLELLAFPDAVAATDAPCTGIDHSAISVSDTASSIAFYESFGFSVGTRSWNRGAEQDRLDGGEDLYLEVSGLVPAQAAPHLELLCYRNVPRRARVPGRSNDVASSRLVFLSRDQAGAGGLLIADPDGHAFVVGASQSCRTTCAGSRV